ncbi:hypothetical protein ACFB49_22390 [Sphingomonas sp. DBB INV C78]|uniref:DUF1254 domain-containing protein n=1 Tax=Sphingomonas sp. DBB INV C78 TaxID=3349434 RepID=UPI0036D318B5
MSRYMLLAALALVAPGAASAAISIEATTTAAIFDGATSDAHDLAVRAYVWGMPLVQAARIRLARTSSKGAPSFPPAPLNQFGHATRLVDPSWRGGVGPNNDTLYSLAWIDLSQGPLVLETPDFGKRYYTFQLGLADSSTEFSPGQRTHGAKLPPVLIYGSNYQGPVPDGMLGQRIATRYALIAGRFLVDGEEDVAAVRKLQSGIHLRPLNGSQVAPPPQRPLPAVPPGDADLSFLYQLGAVLKDWTVPPQDGALVASFATIGLTSNQGFDPGQLEPAMRAEIARGLADGAEIVRRKSLHLGENVNGWTINYQGARLGSDYLLRAGVAKDQIFVTLPEEALYPIARADADDRPLDGRNAYEIVFPRNQLPPADAFWSITLYGDDGYMVANPIERYSIGDRTRGLTYSDDGSLTITLQHEQPEAARQSNWLPTPDGPFYLMMRLYIPRSDALTKAWVPPAIVRADDAGR